MYPQECGEIRFTLTPEHAVTYLSDSMLKLLDAGSNDDEWISVLKSRPYFFLTEKDIPAFKECCHKAACEGVPIYFEHSFFDRFLRKIKAHSFIYKLCDSDEFLMIVISDSDINRGSKADYLRAVEYIYDDVFEINTDTASVKIIKNQSAIDFDCKTQVSFWDFEQFLLTRLIHPDDRKGYLSFLNTFDFGETSTETGIEFRMQKKSGEICWLKMTLLYVSPHVLLLCFSDTTSVRDISHLQMRLKTDNITTLMNREAFEEACRHAFTKEESENNYCLLIEIDHFDDFSLEKQDDLLKKTGRLLASHLGNNAIYAWFGNKKFIVCFHGLEDKSETKKKINDLFKYLQEQCAENSMPGYSLGYSRCTFDFDKGYNSAYEHANTALKDAMRSGGNTIRDYALLSSHSHISRLPHDVKIQTFGYFEVFVDGKPILFKSKKAKELLAVLVDRRGGYISSGDMISYLWEDEPVNPTTNARCRKVAMILKNTLAEYNVDYIIESADRQRRLVSDAVDCDLFHFLNGDESYVNNFDGTYMLNYSWSEWTASYLSNIKETESENNNL